MKEYLIYKAIGTGAGLLLSVLLLLLAMIRRGRLARWKRLGVVCPHRNRHRRFKRVYCVALISQPLFEAPVFECGCGCQFRWFSEKYCQIVRPSDFEPAAERN